MPIAEKQFFPEDVALGAVGGGPANSGGAQLGRRLRATDAAHMWPLALEARAQLEQLEVQLAREEYPPFERCDHETWIRPALSPSNPNRPYHQVRDFIGTEGLGALASMRQF